MNLLQCYLINNECYNAARTMKPAGIVVHSTGANNKTLKRYVQPTKQQVDYMGGKTRQEVTKLLGANKYNNHWNRPGVHKCVSAFIGALDNGSIATVQTLPWNMQTWGVGAGLRGSYNKSHIQFEICEDSLVDSTYFTKVFNEAAELCAYLCKMYNLGVDTIVSHSEAHQAGYGSNHSDPEHWIKRHGETMDSFRRKVSKLLSTNFTIRVIAAALNVRSGPGTQYGITTTIKDGGVYTIVDTIDGWGKLKSGAGWINLRYTKQI